MPLLRYPPHGIDANITISTPFTIGFDAMGLTDNENPLGLMPFTMPGIPSFGRKRRDTEDIIEPNVEPHTIHGGERYKVFRIMVKIFIAIKEKQPTLLLLDNNVF